MSGGSYDYLYTKEVIDYLENQSNLENLKEMIKSFDNLEFNLISNELRDILNDINNLLDTIDTINNKIYKMRDVMQAMEWYRSNDYRIEDLIKEVKNHYTTINKENKVNE